MQGDPRWAISLSVLLITSGTVLAWGVDTDAAGFDVHLRGSILLVAGIASLVASLVFWSSWGGFGGVREGDGGGGSAQTTVLKED
jgi:hypothetical protein